MTNPIGQTLLNQYRVDAFIASGGMGAVYRVSDLNRNVPLAMKVLHTDLAEDPSIFRRFEREARALKKLAHPNIVPFYGLFKTSDFAFLLEQYVDGPTLKDVLRQRKVLPIEEALVYLKALSAALGYAHVHRVVHCDVKPGNVMIDRGGSIYLTDFGVARHAESTITTLGSAGTPAYMAPEQCRGEAVTAETDVYALGVVLYEMVTGIRPLQAGGTGEKEGSTVGGQIRYAQLYTAPPDPCQANPAIPRTLGDMILKGIEKDPQARYPSTWAMFEAACAALGIDPHTVSDRVVVPQTSDNIPIGANVEPASGTTTIPPSWRQGQRTLIIALALIMVIAIVAIAVNVMKPAATPAPIAVAVTQSPTKASSVTRISADSTTIPTYTPMPTSKPTDMLKVALGIGSTRISDKDGMVMVHVPAGEFLMGSSNSDRDASGDEKPQHKVYLDAFWIDKTEVTNVMFARYASATGYKTNAENFGSGWVYVVTGRLIWIRKVRIVWSAYHPNNPAQDRHIVQS